MSTTELDCSSIIPPDVEEHLSALQKSYEFLKSAGTDITKDKSMWISMSIQVGLDVVVKRVIQHIMDQFLLTVAEKMALQLAEQGIDFFNVVGMEWL